MASTYAVTIDGATLRRGFWLYVWEVTTPGGVRLVYVGRTGDSSSPNAQSPFNRMGQHLGTAKNSSMLRNHLAKRDVIPEECRFRLIGHGPIFEELAKKDMDTHSPVRDKMAGMEKKLAQDLAAAGYDVMNTVRSNAPLDEERYAQVHSAFAAEFSNL